MWITFTTPTKLKKGLRSSGTIPKICKLSMLHHHHAFQEKTTRKIGNLRGKNAPPLVTKQHLAMRDTNSTMDVGVSAGTSFLRSMSLDKIPGKALEDGENSWDTVNVHVFFACI